LDTDATHWLEATARPSYDVSRAWLVQGDSDGT